MSDFGALRIALSGLYASQRGLDVTGHNISNVNTDGYSRQTVSTVANSGPLTPALFSKWNDGGFGVTIQEVTRARDVFLQARSYLEHGADTSLKTTQTTLSRIEQLIGEPSDTGIQQQLADFWSGWQDVSNNPGDLASRTQLVQLAQALTTTFNKDASELHQMNTDALTQLTTTIDEVNTTAANIAQLNGSIQSAQVAGLQTTDLEDQRDQLISQLSNDIGVTVHPDANGMVDVYVDGGPLVRGTSAQTLKVDATGPTVAVRWTKDNYPANSSSGQVGGLLATINDIIPRYSSGLDAVAQTLRDTVNTMHGAIGGALAAGNQDLSAAGSLQFNLTVNGTALPAVSVAGANWSGAGGAAALQTALQTALDTATGTPGQVVATVTGGNGGAMSISIAPANPTDQVQVSAVNGNNGFTTLLGDTLVGLDGVGGRPFFAGTGSSDLSVASDVLTSTDAIAASVASGGALDGHGAQQLAGLATSLTGADTLYRSYVVGLGVEAQSTNRKVSIQDEVTSQVDANQEAQAGVNLDEEMTAMLQYQHAYEASARYMSVVDQTLDTLINHTGA
jgi:flagellar hook-associated protein 1